MRKTSVYLTDEQSARLKRIARAEGRSEAQIVRAAVEAYPEPPRPPRQLLLDGAGEGSGESIADVPEEELLEGFGEESLGEWR
jgi:antitoxin ParD1/3/4